MKIIGAGMAGLVAGNIMRKSKPVILERHSELPDFHTALLRHRSELVSEITSIPFKKVTVTKEIYYNSSFYKEPSIAMMNDYSKKVTAEFHNRSISRMDDEERFISPPDFIKQLSIGLDIKFGAEFDFKNLSDAAGEPIISTIPINLLLKALGMEDELEKFNFSHSAIRTIQFEIDNCDLYQTIYYPSSANKPYRCSITGNKFIFETTNWTDSEYNLFQDAYYHLETDFHIPCEDIVAGTSRVGNMKFGKIAKLQNERELKTLIGKLTREFNIYSLGRFATWRNVLLDDVVNDCFVIQKLMKSNGYYTGR